MAEISTRQQNADRQTAFQLYVVDFYKYDWLCHLAIFITFRYKKGGQVTKPIILVKICYKLLYVIQGVENSFGKVTSWPQLISEFLVAHAC